MAVEGGVRGAAAESGLPYVVDDREGGRFLINRSSMVDDEVLRLERERIFDRCWLYVGHESEIPAVHDTRTRTVAGRPLIFCRDADDEVRVFINSCTHRGNVLCRETESNRQFLKCFFHAWTFNTKGQLVSLMDEAGYGEHFDRAAYTLASPAQVDSCFGFVFVCYDPSAPALREYLGRAADYLEILESQSLGAGMEVLGAASEYAIHANWKLLAENSVDSYHALTTHRRWFDLLAASTGASDVRRAAGISEVHELGNGHTVTRAGVLATEPGGDAARTAIEARHQALLDELGAARTELLEGTRALLIFPNLIVIDLPPGITIRTFEPQSPGVVNVTTWALGEVGEPEVLRRLRLEFSVSFWGPAGLGTPDDIEALEGCQRGFAAAKELPWSDISRGMHRDRRPRGTDELQMRTFWRRWDELITGEPFTQEWP